MATCETVKILRDGVEVIINKSDLTDKDTLAGAKKAPKKKKVK